MPLFKIIKIDSDTSIYFWKITEDLDFFLENVSLKKSSQERLNAMKAESHQKGFLAVRMLLQNCGFSDSDLIYDENGKPNLDESRKSKVKSSSSKNLSTSNLQPPTFISISHSLDFSAIAISNKIIGLDVEKIKEKTLKIAPRFMDISHLANISDSDKIKKATAIWGIKECVFKIKNEVGISFQEHIFEDDFLFEDKKATATLKFNNKVEKYTIQFDVIEDYIFVCAVEFN